MQLAKTRWSVGMLLTGFRFVRVTWKAGKIKAKYFVPATKFSLFSARF